MNTTVTQPHAATADRANHKPRTNADPANPIQTIVTGLEWPEIFRGPKVKRSLGWRTLEGIKDVEPYAKIDGDLVLYGLRICNPGTDQVEDHWESGFTGVLNPAYAYRAVRILTELPANLIVTIDMVNTVLSLVTNPQLQLVVRDPSNGAVPRAMRSALGVKLHTILREPVPAFIDLVRMMEGKGQVVERRVLEMEMDGGSIKDDPFWRMRRVFPSGARQAFNERVQQKLQPYAKQIRRFTETNGVRSTPALEENILDVVSRGVTDPDLVLGVALLRTFGNQGDELMILGGAKIPGLSSELLRAFLGRDDNRMLELIAQFLTAYMNGDKQPSDVRHPAYYRDTLPRLDQQLRNTLPTVLI